jgi:hypothetical protein
VEKEVLSDVMHWKTPKFFGREQELRWIHGHLEGHKFCRKVLAICGLSGLGKTQLVLHYWNKQMREFSSMLWIDATSYQTALDSFEHVAIELGGASALKSPLQYVKRWLSSPSNQNWLMIIENVIDLDGDFRVQELIPSCEHGAVIVTSTQSGTGKAINAETLELSEIDSKAGAQILTSRFKGPASAQECKREGNPNTWRS